MTNTLGLRCVDEGMHELLKYMSLLCICVMYVLCMFFNASLNSVDNVKHKHTRGVNQTDNVGRKQEVLTRLTM